MTLESLLNALRWPSGTEAEALAEVRRLRAEDSRSMALDRGQYDSMRRELQEVPTLRILAARADRHEAALQTIYAAFVSKVSEDADGTGIHFTREEGLALEAVAYREISHLFPGKRAPVVSPAERREADAAEEQRQADAAGRVNVVPRFWPGEV